MKLPKSIQTKETLKLFLDKFNYKISIITPGASFFRGKNLNYAEFRLKEFGPSDFSFKWSKIKNNDELNYCIKLLEYFKNFDSDEYELRVENPIISLYTNNTKYIEKIAGLSEKNVKFVWLPNNKIKNLIPGKLIVKKLDYDYKISMASIRKRNYIDFISWAKNNSKIKLTNKFIRELSRDTSFGGSYFYVKDSKTLTIVKMFLGSDISKIEELIKA